MRPEEHRIGKQRKSARITAVVLFSLSLGMAGLFMYSYPRLGMERAAKFFCKQVPGLAEGRCWYHGFLAHEYTEKPKL